VSFWKPILAAVVIFAAGVVTGGLTLDLRQGGPSDAALADDPGSAGTPPQGWSRGPREGSLREGPPREGLGMGRERHLEELCKRMEKDLGLDRDQREQVEVVIRETHERVRALVEGMRPKTQAEFRKMEEEIKALLTPEQAAKFDELAEQRRERMGRR
jgi:Spy/CpxP family protein refolding chaperone